MISNGFFYLLLISLIWGQPVLSEDVLKNNASESTDIFYLCKRAKLARWLRAYKLDNGKCQTLYSKEGYMQIISSASYYASCVGVLHSVRKNLEEGQFKCELAPKFSVLELD